MTDAKVRELAREILAREEFARWREEPGFVYDWLVAISDALRSAWEWIAARVPDWLSELFSGTSTPASADTLQPLQTLLAGVAVAAVVWLGIALVRGWRAQSRARVAAPRLRVEPASEDLQARADALARDGRFLEAAHAVQLATLQLLLERSWIELDRFEPNRTLRARLSSSALPAELRSEFAALLDRLEARWFGDRSEERSLYLGWTALHERLALLGEAA